MKRVLLLLVFAVFGAAARNAAADETITSDIGSAAGWHWEFKPEGGDWKPITVPGGGWRAQGERCDAGTYRVTLAIPTRAQGRRVRVAFAAVNFGAEVFVGPDEQHLAKVASHINGWLPFTADLTPHVTPGQPALLVVAVQGRRKFMANGKYTVPEGATWFDGVAEGILRGVALQLLPPVHVDDVFVRTRRGPDTVEPQVTVTNDLDKPVKLSIAAQFSSWNRASFRYPKISATTAELGPGESRVVSLGKSAWPAGAGSYWWPNVPYHAGYRAQLHLLDGVLEVNGKPMHRFQQRFGFREFKANGSHYELNGVRCNLRGDSQYEANFGTDAYAVKPGFGPPVATNPGWPQAVDNLLHLNFNALRIHQIPATPFMLDVCDELGLMIVDESPLRGTEGGEDFKAGRTHMLNAVRDLAQRDRGHPSVVLWSAANDWPEPIPDAIKAIQAVDDTRPIIAEGCADLGQGIINMPHFVDGQAALPQHGGPPRADRPFGETAAVWPADNTWQGCTWMATGTRLRRLKGNADIRNYVFVNVWPNYVSGESPNSLVVEKKIKNLGGDVDIHAAIEDPWNHPLLRLVRKCFHPLAVCDSEFDQANALSNTVGDWPTVKPQLDVGARVTRKLTVFNDEFSGDDLLLRWQVWGGRNARAQIATGETPLRIPPGEFRETTITFDTTKDPGEVSLLLAVFKDGLERFVEDQIVFKVGTGEPSLVADGDVRLLARHSGLAAEVSGDAHQADAPLLQATVRDDAIQIWHVKNLGGNEITLTNKKSGQALAVQGASPDDMAAAVQQPFVTQAHQVWRVAIVDGKFVTLTNKSSGKVLDVFERRTEPGAKIVQYSSNGGENQQWELK